MSNQFYKKKYFYLVILIFISSMAQAVSYSIFPLNFESRYKETQAQNYKIITNSNYAFSVDFNQYQFLFEYIEFENKSGNETLSIREATHEIHGNFLFLINDWNRMCQLYTGMGTGVYSIDNKTDYLNTSTKDSAGNTLFLSGLISLQARYYFIHYQADFRILMAKDYYPQPQPGLIFRLGFNF